MNMDQHGPNGAQVREIIGRSGCLHRMRNAEPGGGRRKPHGGPGTWRQCESRLGVRRAQRWAYLVYGTTPGTSRETPSVVTDAPMGVAPRN